MITKIAFVSHPTRDMAASRKFFGDVLGLKQTSSYEDKWYEFDTPDGKSIALDSFSPADTKPYIALETDNLDKEIARLRKLGVPVVMDVMDNKVCKMAIIKDPNGHAVMLHQMEAGRLKALQSSKAGAKGRASAKPAAKAAKAKTKAKSKSTARAKSAKGAAKKRSSAKAGRR